MGDGLCEIVGVEISATGAVAWTTAVAIALEGGVALRRGGEGGDIDAITEGELEATRGYI